MSQDLSSHHLNGDIIKMSCQPPIAQVAERVLASGKITVKDQGWFLKAALSLENPLSPLEQAKVRQVFDRLQMGLLRVVD